MSADLSVIMPLYNCEQWVEEAVRSVLENADGLLELIVVDDGSTDRSAAIVAEIDGPIKLISQQNAGPAAARNTGLKAAEGELIGFLDADDIWTGGSPDPRRGEIANGCDCAIGRAQIFTGDPPRDFSTPLFTVLLCTLLMRREVVDRVGWFDDARVPAEDVDWVMRLRELDVKLGRVEDVVARYRLLRQGSLTSNRDVSRGALVGALRGSLVRRGLMGEGE